MQEMKVKRGDEKRGENYLEFQLGLSSLLKN
jgi:hypothetical protein